MREKTTNTQNSADADSSSRQEEVGEGGEPQLQEGLDYYIEHGLYVFTAEFLRKRGYCCESGCRHCPYQD